MLGRERVTCAARRSVFSGATPPGPLAAVAGGKVSMDGGILHLFRLRGATHGSVY